jgi:NAD(P)H-dependent FMN reductase
LPRHVNGGTFASVKPKLSVIIASTRPGRVGLPVAEWFVERAAAHGGFSVAQVDLKEVALPLMDEPKHPRLAQYEHEHTKRWSAMVRASDAFVLVTPEYNYGVSPALVNAFDAVYNEWGYKAAGFVSYGGVAGGTRAVQMAKQILTTLKVVPLVEAVAIPFVSNHLADGKFKANDIHEKAAQALLDELLRWTNALAPLRA